jgi:guanylate kinase
MSLIGGFPVILSAPSGGGKTTIAKALLARRPDLGYSVSCTTRAPRPGEIEGRDYYFISRADFIAERERGAFAESAVVHGNLYGTLRREVERVIAEGKHVVMDIDVQGAGQFVKAFPSSVTIFILPPTAEVLLDRLRARKTESPAQLAARLQSALQELQQVDEYESTRRR